MHQSPHRAWLRRLGPIAALIIGRQDMPFRTFFFVAFPALHRGTIFVPAFLLCSARLDHVYGGGSWRRHVAQEGIVGRIGRNNNQQRNVFVGRLRVSSTTSSGSQDTASGLSYLRHTQGCIYEVDECASGLLDA